MLLTRTKALLGAHREASEQVARGKRYSVDLPVVGRVLVPPPEQIAIYAALGGLAVLELIDWPVAVAMGVGSALISRHLSELESREEELAEAIAPESDGSAKASTDPAAKKRPVQKPPAKKRPAKTANRKTPAAE